jgi:cobyrinic acid a,c-diamide synthase
MGQSLIVIDPRLIRRTKRARAGGRRQEAGGRRQEAGGRSQEAGGRSQEAGGRRQEAGGKSLTLKILHPVENY